MDTEKDVQSQKQQPVVLICGKCHKENEIKSKYPIKCRDCEYRIIYTKNTKILLVSDAQ
ncbi:DNA-directed RNA polymerases I, II, and III subunit RPABC4-like [Phoca vitulina]|uniref:DNA-directed RNA polymerases I, II, and III subunit RPABC4-like n=1 Tax=Phoca vitulina TaxID=9720 RepID=UPI001395DCB0|nr:DNA-directed RNA polymerases I, II, and III subunit RPABC4-like [Phoca vitulina]XP_035972192.1 DNA-directed RNA polymerases I, II, and III subunit RPABC4-like [Halichoerus grypus]